MHEMEEFKETQDPKMMITSRELFANLEKAYSPDQLAMRGWKYVRPLQANGLKDENVEDGMENMTLQSNGLNENKDNSTVLDSEEEAETDKTMEVETKATSSNDDHILTEESYTPTIAFNKETEAIFDSDPKWIKKFIQGLWSTIDYLFQKA